MAVSAAYLSKLFGLHGRTAIVTGSTAGLGRAFAESLAQAGATVVVNGRSQERAEQAVEEMTAALGGPKQVKLLAISGDVSNYAEAERLMGATVEQCGKIDILVNNAGINLEEKPFSASSLADWQKIQRVNIEGPINATKLALKHIKKSPAGRIINLSSILGLDGGPDNTFYAMTKGSMQLFTRSLALELATEWPHVTVNSISPGIFETRMNTKFTANTDARAEVLHKVPMHRLGLPQELVGALLFLASDASSYCTGSDITVDGGYVAQ